MSNCHNFLKCYW